MPKSNPPIRLIKLPNYCVDCNIEWSYEAKTFDLGTTTYTPDFYLPKTDEYIEIKGYFSDNSKIKINIFKTLYPDIKFKILLCKDLEALGLLHGGIKL